MRHVVSPTSRWFFGRRIYALSSVEQLTKAGSIITYQSSTGSEPGQVSQEGHILISVLSGIMHSPFFYSFFSSHHIRRKHLFL